MSWLTETLIAHRGLFDNAAAPENSLAAFEKAVEAGYGIELDVHLSNSGELLVHHDFSLLRTCKKRVKIEEINAENRDDFRLFGTNETIPTLDEVLALVNGKSPIVVEIKNRGDCRAVCEKTAQLLDGYNGEYCVESFDPEVVKWFFENRPEVRRGQLAEYPVVKWWRKGAFKRMRLEYADGNRPDFIAYCVFQAPNSYIDAVLKKYPETELVFWTVRTPEQLKKARSLGAGIIFEQSAFE